MGLIIEDSYYNVNLINEPELHNQRPQAAQAQLLESTSQISYAYL